MPKPSPVETALDNLVALRADPSAPGVRDALVKALSSKTNLIAAKAAQLVEEFKRDDLAKELVAAFDRFIPNAPKADKGCHALTACAKALVETDERGDADGARRVFLAGVRHVQREPVWGGSVDVAGELRGVCGMGLAKIGYPHALVELTDLLGDPEPQARAGAARALGNTGQDAAALLLRLKLAQGDKEPDVLGECMNAVCRLAPRWAIEYVARFLDDDDPAVRGTAALALGDSRKPAALEPLLTQLKREREGDVRRPLMLAVAMLRTPESREALLEVIRTGQQLDAVDAVEALAIYRSDATVRAQVEAAVMPRNDPGIIRPFRAAFPA